MRLIRLVLTALAAVLFLPYTAAPAGAQGSVAVAPVVPGTPRILFAGRPLPVPSPDLAPYRDPRDRALCVAPESLVLVGVQCVLDIMADTASLSTAEGGRTTVRTRRAPNGRDFVPLVEAMEDLGAKCQWDPATNTEHVRAILTEVAMLGGQLRIKATLPITATVVNRRSPAQVIVDVSGAELGRVARVIPLGLPNVSQIRTGQFDGNTARIVLDLKEAAGLAAPLTQPATLLALNPLPTQPPPIVIQIPPQAPSDPPRPPATPVPPRTAPTIISGITFRHVNDRQAQIVISAGRAPGVRSNLTRDRLTLDLLNARLGDNAAAGLAAAGHPLLRAASAFALASGGARLAVELTRVVSFSVSPQGRAGDLVLDIALPRSAGGRLAGKLVVVDPGHGDHDPGARGVNGSYEKNVNLAIGRALRDRLREAGANVIMTRSDDTFISLGERSRIANRAGADFFISVHGDSSRNRATAGSTVYYHKRIGAGRALAQTIAERFADMGGIPTKGVRSDSVLYSSGLAVLRNARMVAVLVECGYMSNPGDCGRLTSPAMQGRVATAIADGLRDYIEGNPDGDTRNVNPRAGGAAQESTPPFDPGPGAAAPGPTEQPGDNPPSDSAFQSFAPPE